jgi:DNA processing protein
MLEIQKLPKNLWGPGLENIPCPPNTLYIKGIENYKKLREQNYKFLTIVGSRKFTQYGEDVCRKIISQIRDYPVCIVSGLAYGIDSIAHRLAMENGMKTIAFPGSGLDNSVIYPQAHYELASDILKSGGALISEFDNKAKALPWMFPQRNRLMVGISDGVLIIEAGEKSGSGISANMAIEYDRNLMAVPGSIFNHNSTMTNNLIARGAHVVTSGEDVLQLLGFDQIFQSEIDISKKLSEHEKRVLELLQSGLTDKDEILKETSLPAPELNRVLTKLEIEGLI